ncbi:PEP/pyruvate-binding domain-containing protein [Streptomyces sp. NPDC020742]|uniref:PEP/pyruvate-binding domain-containing protein n=1 Tax=Streptomyces sp. NPDC020742 TaxID=3154897 RepID=UPI0033F994B7
MGVLALSQTGLADVPAAGRKAAVLGELTQAGFDVPAGWVLGTELLAAAFGPGGDRSRLRESVAEILTEAGDAPLAVRSSGVAEDLEGMSYAGQYESVLNCRGLDDVLDAVRTCWESGSSERLTAYQGDAQGGGVAVLVQEMVDADVAGVAFSVNVLTADPDEVVISAVRGLGERLMSGEATAEEWAVRDGAARRTSGEEKVADEALVLQVAELARAVADRFGAPQDVEWAVTDGRLRLLQARPVTGLPDELVPHVPIPVEVPPGSSMRDPNFDRPWTPFVRSTFLPVFTRAAPHVFAFTTGATPRPAVIGGWPYVTLRPDTMSELVARLEEIAGRFAADEPLELVNQWEDGWKTECATAVAELRAVDPAALDNPSLTAHFHRLLDAFATLHDRYFRLSGASAGLLGRLGATCAELLGWDAAKTLRLRGGLVGDHVPATSGVGDMARYAAGRPGVRAALEAGERPADPGFDALFTAYLAAYGHRTAGFTLAEPTLAEQPEVLLGMVGAQLDAPYDLDAERTRLDERRAAAVAEARTALAGRPEADRERFERCLRGSDISAPIRDEKSFYAVSLWALLRYAVLEAGSRLVAAGMLTAREDVMFLEQQEVLAALAGQAPAEGLVRRRRGEHAWALAHPGPQLLGQPPAPPRPEPDMTPPSEAAQAVMRAAEWSMGVFGAGAATARQEEDTLHGVAASAGRRTGRARIITGVADFGRLRAGEVLVCPETTAQWAILFPAVGALVTDRGSLLSHPAIIAREYGVPAVVATRTATAFLRDGDLVTVDGNTGTVRRERAGGSEEGP